MHIVELTPAQAPATNEAEMGSFGASPGLGDRFLLTVSYTKSCTRSDEESFKTRHSRYQMGTLRAASTSFVAELFTNLNRKRNLNYCSKQHETHVTFFRSMLFYGSTISGRSSRIQTR